MRRKSARIFIQSIIILLCICFSTKNYAREQDDWPHLWEGNLALPISQQPGPIVSFGQNILDKGDFLILAEYDRLKGNHQTFDTIAPNIIYGINDHSSFYVRIPIAVNFKQNCEHSSGIGDITAQYEYAYYFKSRYTYALMGTVVGNIGFPTGSLRKQPPTGFGSTSFFLGTTFSYIAPDWLAYGGTGAILTTSHHGNKIGNSFLYQLGFGHNIAYRTREWLLSWVVEFNGTYMKRDKFHHVKDKNTGGNVIFAEYTLWFATEQLTATAGMAVPITQHLFGHQNRNNYYLEIVIGWKFNS